MEQGPQSLALVAKRRVLDIRHFPSLSGIQIHVSSRGARGLSPRSKFLICYAKCLLCSIFLGSIHAARPLLPVITHRIQHLTKWSGVCFLNAPDLFRLGSADIDQTVRMRRTFELILRGPMQLCP
jgi:hypothetical protein